jgi:hypothetical protein
MIVVAAEFTIRWNDNGTEVRQTVSVPAIELSEKTGYSPDGKFMAVCPEWNAISSSDFPAQAVGNIVTKLAASFKIGNLEA